MNFYETRFLHGLPLGKLYWDVDNQLGYFETGHDVLRPLMRLKWFNLDEARQAIEGYAIEAGMGGVHHAR